MAPMFDWSALLRFGLSHLRLSPSEFWQLTPKELSLMARPRSPQAQLGQRELQTLLEQYPDAQKASDNDI